MFIISEIPAIVNPFAKERIIWKKDFSEIIIKKGSPISFWLDFGAIFCAVPGMTIVGNEDAKIVLHMLVCIKHIVTKPIKPPSRSPAIKVNNAFIFLHLPKICITKRGAAEATPLNKTMQHSC